MERRWQIDSELPVYTLYIDCPFEAEVAQMVVHSVSARGIAGFVPDFAHF